MAVTWNSGDKSANITLSGGSLIAASTSASQGSVRATSSFSSGKLYFEVLLNTIAGGNTGIGWANATASLTAFIGNDKNGVAAFPATTNTQFWFNNINQGTLGRTGTSGDILRIAFDIGAKLIWFALGGTFWNGNGSADPATGSGGLNLSTMNAGPYFPIFGANSSGATVTANFGATAFFFPIPSGFSGVDTNTITYVASSKFSGQALLAPPQTAADASKFSGLALLAPPQAAAVSAKFVGYAVLISKPMPYSRQRQYTYLRN